MKHEEKLAEQYLKSKGFICKYEPDGNIPPDFLIDNTIAIEVRRLNQNSKNGENIEGLEDLQFRLRNKVKGLLSKIKSKKSTRSFLVSYFYMRPLHEENEFMD